MTMIDKNQTSVLALIFNSIHFERWQVLGKNTGFYLKDDFGKRVHYALNPIHWNTNLPPAFYWDAPAPSPEYRLQKMVDDHFESIEKLLAKNDWLKPTKSIIGRQGTALLFSVTGLSSHAVTCPYELGDEDMISCKQLIILVKEELLKKIRTLINEEILGKIGKVNYQDLKHCELHQRTHKFLRLMQTIA
jgi:hypothetical protein